MFPKFEVVNSARKTKDCFTCRTIGVLTFSGISSYAIYLRMNTPSHDKGQRIFLGVFAIGALSMAIVRGLY